MHLDMLVSGIIISLSVLLWFDLLLYKLRQYAISLKLFMWETGIYSASQKHTEIIRWSAEFSISIVIYIIIYLHLLYFTVSKDSFQIIYHVGETIWRLKASSQTLGCSVILQIAAADKTERLVWMLNGVSMDGRDG